MKHNGILGVVSPPLLVLRPILRVDPGRCPPDISETGFSIRNGPTAVCDWNETRDGLPRGTLHVEKVPRRTMCSFAPSLGA